MEIPRGAGAFNDRSFQMNVQDPIGWGEGGEAVKIQYGFFYGTGNVLEYLFEM